MEASAGALAGAAGAGFGAGLSLILAIGAQNAFVLRQGLAGRHVLLVCAICAVSDAVLIAVGVAGFGAAATAAPWLATALVWGGAAFLIAYGALRFRAALSPSALAPAAAMPLGAGAAAAQALAFTWLNPHVYLDTLALLGALGAAFEGAARAAFALGAATASFVFFFTLGCGARALASLFARPAAWRALDVGIGALMWALAAGLALRGA